MQNAHLYLKQEMRSTWRLQIQVGKFLIRISRVARMHFVTQLSFLGVKCSSGQNEGNTGMNFGWMSLPP